MLQKKWLKRASRLALALCGTALLVTDAYPHFRDGTHVFIGLAEVVGGLYCIGFALGLKPWSSLAWALRGLLVALAYCVYQGHCSWRVEDWIVVAVLAVGAAVGQYAAHREALGFVYDERNERQRVKHFSRGQAIYEPTTHSERVVLEATLKAERRRKIAASILLGGVPALCAWWLRETSYSMLALFIAFFASPFLFVAAWELLVELAYQSGSQQIRGAKVLDAEPVKMGLGEVERQKVYGDPGIATAEEALAALQSM